MSWSVTRKEARDALGQYALVDHIALPCDWPHGANPTTKHSAVLHHHLSRLVVLLCQIVVNYSPLTTQLD